MNVDLFGIEHGAGVADCCEDTADIGVFAEESGLAKRGSCDGCDDELCIFFVLGAVNFDLNGYGSNGPAPQTVIPGETAAEPDFQKKFMDAIAIPHAKDRFPHAE